MFSRFYSITMSYRTLQKPTSSMIMRNMFAPYVLYPPCLKDVVNCRDSAAENRHCVILESIRSKPLLHA